MPVTVIRGRASTPRADRRVSAELLDRAAVADRRIIRVWRPPQHLAVGRLDIHRDGYDRAVRIAETAGFTPLRRTVGGRAVAVTDRCVALLSMYPIDDPRVGVEGRYETVRRQVAEALTGLGAEVAAGEPPDSFCPGSHSLRGSGKLAGFGQRIRSDVALVGGIVLVDDIKPIARVLGPVYQALGYRFEPDSLGSVAASNGTGDPAAVRSAIESAILDGASHEIETVADRET